MNGIRRTVIENPGVEIEKIEARLKWAFIEIVTLFVVILVLAGLLWVYRKSLSAYTMITTGALLTWSVAVMFYAFDNLHRTSHTIRERLEDLTFVDDATGVFNYRYLHTRLKEECERIRRYGGSTAMLYMDLDKFKLVNDRFGHQTGNVVLWEVAQLLKRTIRGCDIIGRIGGDEFLAILPETDSVQGGILAERLRASIEEFTYEVRAGQTIDFIGLSVGVASYPQNGDTMEHVMHAADDAVYRAKAQGGNIVCVAQEYVGEVASESKSPGVQG